MMADTAPPPDRAAFRDGRRRAREAAVQLLYQWDVRRLPIADIAPDVWGLRGPEGALDAEHRRFAELLASGVVDALERIDPLIAEAATHWRIERMNMLDRLILRLAVYELLEQPETPGKVIINEALELARTFSSDDAVRFVNGILDAIRRGLERA